MLSFLVRTSFATLSCVTSLAVAPICGIWHANSRTPLSSSRSSIRTSNTAVLTPPVESGAVTVSANRPVSRRGRSDSYITAAEYFQSPELHNEQLHGRAPEDEYDDVDETRARRRGMIAVVLKPPDATHIRTRRLLLSISLLAQVCVHESRSL